MSDIIIALIICIFLFCVGCLIIIIIVKPSKIKIEAKLKDAEFAIDLDNCNNEKETNDCNH